MLDEINEKLKELTNLKDLSSQQLIQRKEIVVKEMNKLVVLINDSSQDTEIHERAHNIFDLYQVRLREILVATLNDDLKAKKISKSSLNYLLEDSSTLVVEGVFDKNNIESFFTDMFVKVVLIDLNFKEIRVVNAETGYAKKVLQKEYKKFNGIEDAVMH